MHDHRSDDARAQRAVLSLVLAAHPTPLTIPRLAEQVGSPAAERAVLALVNVGLLECGGISVRPTEAALHFDRLELP